MCLIIAGLVSVSAARAQGLASEIVESAAQLDSAQRSQVDGFVQSLVTTLTTSDDDQAIAGARRSLIAEFSKNPKEPFLRAYSNAIVNQVVAQRGLESDRNPVNRLNTLIVLNEVYSPMAAGPIATVLSSNSPADRYWAGRAANNLATRKIAGNPVLAKEESTTLDQALAQAIAHESQHAVRAQMLKALASLTNAGNAKLFMDAISTTVPRHLEDPALPMQTEMDTFLKVIQELIRNAQGTNKPQIDVLRSVARTSWRFYELTATLLRDHSQTLPPNTATDLTKMLRNCDTTLRWSVKEIEPKLEKDFPAVIDNEAASGQWALVLVRSANWLDMLTKPPLNFASDNLDIKKP